MKLNLPSSVSSSQDLASTILELRDYARWFSHNAVKEHVHAQRASTPPDLSPAAVEIIKSRSDKNLLTPQVLDGLIAELEAFRSSAATLTITLVAPPTNDLRRQLVTWCRENISPVILINFEFNTTLLGGMIVRYGSHIYDWSFRRAILDGRTKFPEVLRNV